MAAKGKKGIKTPSTTPYDYQLINVNITSSSPPKTTENYCSSLFSEPELRISRANSTKQHGGQQHDDSDESPNRKKNSSRKLSTITFKEPSIIKRPNSTIGIPSSVIPNSHSFQNSFSNKSSIQFDGGSSRNSQQQIDDDQNQDMKLNLKNTAPTRTTTTIETPETEIFSVEFNPVVREKAASLTLPDSKLHFFRKGSSNSFLTTQQSSRVSPGQFSLPTQRASIILNGNVLHSLNPLEPEPRTQQSNNSSNQLSINLQENQLLSNQSQNYENSFHGSSRLLNSVLKPRGSVMSNMTNHRSSFIEDEENFHLHQRYLATTARKDTIISIGKNLQIQFRSPSTSGLAWHYRTCFEKFLLFVLLVLTVLILAYLYIPSMFSKGLHHQLVSYVFLCLFCVEIFALIDSLVFLFKYIYRVSAKSLHLDGMRENM